MGIDWCLREKGACMGEGSSQVLKERDPASAWENGSLQTPCRSPSHAAGHFFMTVSRLGDRAGFWSALYPCGLLLGDEVGHMLLSWSTQQSRGGPDMNAKAGVRLESEEPPGSAASHGITPGKLGLASSLMKWVVGLHGSSSFPTGLGFGDCKLTMGLELCSQWVMTTFPSNSRETFFHIIFFAQFWILVLYTQRCHI